MMNYDEKEKNSEELDEMTDELRYLLGEEKGLFDPDADFDEDDEEYIDNIITLTGEDGREVDFEFLDLIEYEGNEYVVLLSVDEEEDEVTILRVISDDDSDEENYESVQDEDTLRAVFEIFKEQNSDNFNFVD